MMDLKSLSKKGIVMVSLAAIVGVGYISFSNYNKVHSPKVVTVIGNVYNSEVKKPEWITKNADLIVIGQVVGKDSSVKVKANTKDADDVVYTDTNIKILKTLKNKQNEDIKAGDKISIRTLGGTVDNLIVHTDTDNLLPDTGTVLLYLSDISHYPSIPQTASDNPSYSIVGEIHGAFNIQQKTSDGKELNLDNISENSSETLDSTIILKRSAVQDEFKLSDLEKIIKEEK